MTLAIVPAPALGDGILGMVLAHNAHRAGRDVVVLHDALTELAAWYPWARIEPSAAAAARLLASDAAFLGDPALHPDAAQVDGPTLCFGKQHWRRDRPYLESLRAVCMRAFDLPSWDDDAGIVPAAARRPIPRRVALHPTSANPAKEWPPDRWLALADKLRAHEWLPVVLVAAEHEAAWRARCADDTLVVAPGTLDKVAAWLRDGAGCIATDSGIAHLASALGVPTLAVFRKRSAARFWGPAWAPGGTIAPFWRLPGGRGHGHWRGLLHPERVFRAFQAFAPGAWTVP